MPNQRKAVKVAVASSTLDLHSVRNPTEVTLFTEFRAGGRLRTGECAVLQMCYVTALHGNIWKFVGVQYSGEYPHTYLWETEKAIGILLSTCARVNQVKQTWQIAHECVHILSPVTRGNATVLEEGMATLFQMKYMEEYMAVDDETYNSYRDSLAKYRTAWDLVKDIPNLNNTIMNLRKEFNGGISSITVDALVKECGYGFPVYKAELLCSKFLNQPA